MSQAKLTPDLLVQAYSLGYFPMPDPQSGEIVFLRPDPRAVLPLNGFHASKSLRRRLRQGDLSISTDQCFEDVMRGCADREDTWITPAFFEGYTALFDQGMAHSVEIWKEGKLVAGIYGVTLGAAFFAESKYHKVRDTSKIALWGLVHLLRSSQFQLLEVQFTTDHLKTLGVQEWPDPQYQETLERSLTADVTFPVLPTTLIEADHWISTVDSDPES